MSYEGYGIRARKDLTANARPYAPVERQLSAVELDKAAHFLNGLCADADFRRSAHVIIPAKGAKRLVDALFLAAHALGTQR